MPVNVLFISATLEPGNCGVADFILSLARKLSARGLSCACLAIHDQYIEPSPELSIDCTKLQNIEIARISAQYSWKQKSRLIQSQFNTFNPDWISLHYVPYAFNSKGVPIAFLQSLSSLVTPAKWEITAHELWVDSKQNLRYRMLSMVQAFIFKKLCANLRVSQVHVTNHSYKTQLERLSIDSGILPVFSNIPICPISLPSAESDSTWRFVLFGTINREWSPFQLLQQIEIARCMHGIRSCHFVSVGKLDPYGATLWDSLDSLTYPAFRFSRLGMLPSERLSAELQYADFGICVVPDVLIEKSGSVAAMLAHGLPIIICRLSLGSDLWHQELRRSGHFILLDSSFARCLGNATKYAPIDQLDETTTRFLESLNLPNRFQTSL